MYFSHFFGAFAWVLLYNAHQYLSIVWIYFYNIFTGPFGILNPIWAEPIQTSPITDTLILRKNALDYSFRWEIWCWCCCCCCRSRWFPAIILFNKTGTWGDDFVGTTNYFKSVSLRCSFHVRLCYSITTSFT